MRATVEYERKLDAPPGFRLPALGGRALRPRAFTSIYYDVPGRALATAGITLRHRTEDRRGVWQLKLPSDDARLELEAEGAPHTPPAEILRLLRTHLRHGPLESVAELRTRRQGELVARNGTTAEVTVDEVAVMDAQRVREEFVEVELELRTGAPEPLDAIAAQLVEAGATPGKGLPKVFRALGVDTGPAPADTPFEALRALLRQQLREIEQHDPGTRLGRDPESLHDMRVAVRRSRALLRAGRRLVATDTTGLSARLKELGSVLGAVRDLDVFRERVQGEAASLPTEERHAVERLLQVLGREQAPARRRLIGFLDSQDYLDLLKEFERCLDELAPSGDPTSLDKLAARQGKKLRRLADALPEVPSAEQLHGLRKQGKRARYAAELAGHEKVVKRAKRLQDLLGAHQDAVVAEQRLRELAAQAPSEHAFVAGRLAERESARRDRAAAEWPQAWKKLLEAL